MTEFTGISYSKEEKYSLFWVNEFTDDIKDAIRDQFSEICHGEDNAHTGRRMYSYKSTVKEFIKRYEHKPENIQIGMIGELMVHLVLSNYFDEFKSVTPFFNMEERSIKKGYDVVLTEVDSPNLLWITEVKSGKLHINKTSNQTMNDLIGTANIDLVGRLNEDNISLWMEAINGAKVSFDSKNTMKDAVIEVLSSWGDDASEGIYTSRDKNVILTGVLFADNADAITTDNIKRKQERVEQEKFFKKVYVLALQKETYAKVYNFLKEEVLDEKC